MLKGKVELIGVKLSGFKEWFYTKDDKDKLEKNLVILSLDQKGVESVIYGPFNIPLETREVIFKFTPDGKKEKMCASLHSKREVVINYARVKDDGESMLITIGREQGAILI